MMIFFPTIAVILVGLLYLRAHVKNVGAGCICVVRSWWSGKPYVVNGPATVIEFPFIRKCVPFCATANFEMCERDSCDVLKWGAKLVGPDASAATFQFSRRSEFAAVHFVTDLRRVKGEDEIYQHLAANTYLIDLALTDENVRDATEEHASVMELVHDHVFLQKSLPSWITVKRGKDPAAVPLCQPAPSCLICSKRALLTPDIMQKLWLAKQGRRLWLGSAAIAALMS
jgi:hypothetical protein